MSFGIPYAVLAKMCLALMIVAMIVETILISHLVRLFYRWLCQPSAALNQLYCVAQKNHLFAEMGGLCWDTDTTGNRHSSRKPWSIKLQGSFLDPEDRKYWSEALMDYCGGASQSRYSVVWVKFISENRKNLDSVAVGYRNEDSGTSEAMHVNTLPALLDKSQTDLWARDLAEQITVKGKKRRPDSMKAYDDNSELVDVETNPLRFFQKMPDLVST